MCCVYIIICQWWARQRETHCSTSHIVNLILSSKIKSFVIGLHSSQSIRNKPGATFVLGWGCFVKGLTLQRLWSVNSLLIIESSRAARGPAFVEEQLFWLCYLWTRSFIVSPVFAFSAAELDLVPRWSKNPSAYKFCFLFIFLVGSEQIIFKFRTKLPWALIRRGCKSPPFLENQSNSEVVQKFCHRSQLVAPPPPVRGAFEWLKRFHVVWCPSSFSRTLFSSRTTH